MTSATFSCNPVVTFDLFGLADWVRAEQAAGRIASGEAVEVQVLHTDRETDGNCRWCGCPANEVVVVPWEE